VHGRQNAKFISILDDQQQPIQYGHHQHLQYTSVVALAILTRHYSHNRVRMVQKKDTGEVCHVRIFADYWLINKTGIRLHYLQVRTSTAHMSCLSCFFNKPCAHVVPRATSTNEPAFLANRRCRPHTQPDDSRVIPATGTHRFPVVGGRPCPCRQ
jgi:hypothetical protein